MKRTARASAMTACLSLVVAGLPACGPAEGVVVQELPPMERPSFEARAGLAEIQGGWNLAGWVAPSQATAESVPPETFTSIDFQQQRVDSLSGFLVRMEVSRPFVGEIRRDGIVSLLVPLDESGGGVLAGILDRDTLWLELSTLPMLPIPRGVRAAYVKERVGQTWVRSPTGVLLRDTLVAEPTLPDTLVIAPATEPAATPSRTPSPATQPPATPPPSPAPTTPATGDATPRDTAPVRQPGPERAAQPADTEPSIPEPSLDPDLTVPEPEPVTLSPDPSGS